MQRVRGARVLIDVGTAGAIGHGVCVLVGIGTGDTPDDARQLARRIARLRIFENAEAGFDRSVLDVGGSVLVVSQFTLLADTAKGNRPSFSAAARPDVARPLYEALCDRLREQGLVVETGVFGARMLVEIENDGPVTIVLET